MLVRRTLFIVWVLCFMCVCSALGEGLEPLPMDSYVPGPVPADSGFLSDNEFKDASIYVKLYEDRYADTDYVYAYIKISHPSQLRTAPATIADKRVNISNINFRYTSELTARGRQIANHANAVVSINGDYFIKTDKCQVVFRQGQQVRNAADGSMDLLVIDKNGDFSALPHCTKAQYNEYLDAHQDEMYNVFCFGPVLVENGASVIDESYLNKGIGSQNSTQRSAIAQLGPLEYMIITCNGPQSKNNKGMTMQEFAAVCEQAGKALSENGCLLAFNLDGGNSSTMNFRFRTTDTTKDKKFGPYTKVNCPEIERYLSDIIYFATLVK